MSFDPEVFGAYIAADVKARIGEAVGPLIARIAALEADLAVARSAVPQSVEEYTRERGLQFITAECAKEWPATMASIRAEVVEIGKQIAPLVDGLAEIRRDVPVREEIDLDSIKAAILAEIPAPKDGRSVDPAEVKAMVEAAVGEAVAKIPPAKDGEPGKDVDPEAVKGMVAEAVSASIRDASIEEVVSSAVVKAVSALPPPEPGRDGKSINPEEVSATIKAMVDGAIAALPVPKDGEPGKSVTVDDVAPLIAAEIAKAVAAIPVPKDGLNGVGLAGALIDRTGNLVITLTNGETKELGRVVGEAGADVDTDSVMTFIKESVAVEVGKIKVPVDGKDGLGFDDFSVEFDGERSFKWVFQRGSERKEFLFATNAMIYRGVFTDGTYLPGDVVTWGGSLWHCNAETSVKPDSGSKDWTLCAKKGRDGKDGRNGIDKTAPVKLDPEKK